jgi:hypothetical protein
MLPEMSINTRTSGRRTTPVLGLVDGAAEGAAAGAPLT